jgi:hypothetical protein
MRFWVMFGEVVHLIVFSFLPYKDKLAFGNAILLLIEAHIDGFGPALLHSIVCDPSSSGIVSGDGRDILGMAHFGEDNLQRTGFLGVVELSSKFCFKGL